MPITKPYGHTANAGMGFDGVNDSSILRLAASTMAPKVIFTTPSLTKTRKLTPIGMPRQAVSNNRHRMAVSIERHDCHTMMVDKVMVNITMRGVICVSGRSRANIGMERIAAPKPKADWTVNASTNEMAVSSSVMEDRAVPGWRILWAKPAQI